MLAMNKYFAKILGLVTITAFILIIFSRCSDSRRPHSSGYSLFVCTEWGASKSEVLDIMKSYETNADENDFICYTGKHNVHPISYQFQDDGLQSSLVMIPEDKTTKASLQALFNRYEYLGEKDGMEIYVSNTENTMAAITRTISGNAIYYAIGYTVLNTQNHL